MNFSWQDYFKSKFREIGGYINQNSMRISMPPGQYTVLNSKNDKVVQNSIKELEYHVDVLNLLGLDSTAKVITHVGGVYGDKKNSIKRFIERYRELDEKIKNHYVIENDDKYYQLKDYLLINESTEIPIILDVYHHYCHNQGESLKIAIELTSKTWRESDGLPIDTNHFMSFIKQTINFNFDLILEIKNKEKSALIAIKNLINDIRFNQNLVELLNN